MRRLLVPILAVTLLLGTASGAFAAWLTVGSGAASSAADEIPDATGVQATRDSESGVTTVSWDPLAFAGGEPIGVTVERTRTLPAGGTDEVTSCEGTTGGICTDTTPEGQWRYDVGGTYQQWSGGIDSVSVDVPPNAPTGASRSGAANPATIQWTDNSEIETGYRLERNPGNGWVTAVNNLPANSTSATDTLTIPCGQTYQYRTIATHGALGGSSPSNVVNVQGPACAATRLSVKALTVQGTGDSRTITVTAQNEHGAVEQGVDVQLQVSQNTPGQSGSSSPSCITGGDGTCPVSLSRASSGTNVATTWSVNVTGMSKSGMTYTASDNAVSLPVTGTW